MKRPTNLAAPPVAPCGEPPPILGAAHPARESSTSGRGGDISKRFASLPQPEDVPAKEVADYAESKGDKKAGVNFVLGSPEEQHAMLQAKLARVTDQPGPEPEDKRYRNLSPVDFADLVIPDADTLLNDHFLDRGHIMLYVGSSGMGKSSSSIYIACGLGVGREVMGFVPSRPLRVLVLGSEDSDYDLKIMCEGALLGMELSQEELELLRQNVRIEAVNWAAGGHFLLEVLLPLMNSFRPDIVIINPFNAYLGGSNRDEEKTVWFLREMLNPMLSTFKCGAIVVHHTPKTNFQKRDEWSHNDFMYAGAGGADMVNAARAVVFMEPTADPAVFRFIGAKRGRNLGWTDSNGKPVYERYFCYGSKHGKPGMSWEPATKEDIRAAGKKKANKPSPFDRIVSLLDYLSRAKSERERSHGRLVALLSERFGVSLRTAKSVISDAVEHGYIENQGESKRGSSCYTITEPGLVKLNENSATVSRLQEQEPEQPARRANPVKHLEDQV